MKKARALRFLAGTQAYGLLTRTGSSLAYSRRKSRRVREKIRAKSTVNSTAEFGEIRFTGCGIDAPATQEQKATLAKLSAANIRTTELAGEKVERILTAAPGDGNPIGGIKVEAKNG